MIFKMMVVYFLCMIWFTLLIGLIPKTNQVVQTSECSDLCLLLN